MILVTGATGNVGREAVKLLLKEGPEMVAVTREPATAALRDGARVLRGEPSHQKTPTQALDRVTAVVLNPATVGDALAELLPLAAETEKLRNS